MKKIDPWAVVVMEREDTTTEVVKRPVASITVMVLKRRPEEMVNGRAAVDSLHQED